MKKPNLFEHMIMYFPTRLVLGVLLVVGLPCVILWLGYTEHTKAIAIYSVIMAACIYLTSQITLKKINNFPGEASGAFIVPVITTWFCVGITVFLLFRLPYSVWYLSVSLVFLVAYAYYAFMVEKRYSRVRMCLLPYGRAAGLKDISNIEWEVISELENMPTSAKSDIPVVTDLHASELSDNWQHFLAATVLAGVPVYHHRNIRESMTGRVRIIHLYENELGSLLPSRVYQLMKRLLDIGLILISAPVVLPVMLITGFLIIIESRGGVFFLQERIGQGGVPFTMYKFRSMYTGTATDKTTGDSDSRITRIGKFIRKTRIDELPQFYNVLRGEMSLIGPRAEFHKFAEEYEKEIPFYSYRHIVKPGISGWAQVVQGYNFGVDDTKIKLEYDFYYIKNFSFSLDLLIFFKTIQTMLTGFGAR